MFIAYQLSLELVRSLRPVLDMLEARDRDLANQLQRALTSVPLNLGEGARRRAAIAAGSTYAHGSAGEIRAVLDVVAAFGWGDFPEAHAGVDRLLGFLWGLTH